MCFRLDNQFFKNQFFVNLHGYAAKMFQANFIYDDLRNRGCRRTTVQQPKISRVDIRPQH